MSLDYAILGFLNYKPMSGYDLKKFFDESIRHFWHADQSQIYRSLSKLKENGWVEMEVEEQHDRPDRKVHSITEAGRQALLEWMSSPPPMGHPHSAPLIQVFFSGMFTDEQVLEMFRRNLMMMEGMLHSYDSVPQAIEDFKEKIGDEREAYFWGLTYDLGMRTAQAQMEWARAVIDDLENGKVPSVG